MSFTSVNVSLPRQIPLGIKSKVFFSNPLIWSGIGMMVMGVIFLLTFGSMMSLDDLKFKGGEPTVRGKINSVSETNCRENKRLVYEYAFSYTTPDGKSRNGISYITGNDYASGDAVDVEYLSADPAKARIVGMRCGQFSPWIALTGLVGVIGLIPFFLGIRLTRKNIRLLENGWVVNGRVTGKEPTGATVNGRRVYKVMFEFEAEGEKRHAFVRTHRIERLLDEATERVLYNPEKPGEATMIDSLPNAVRSYFES